MNIVFVHTLHQSLANECRDKVRSVAGKIKDKMTKQFFKCCHQE